MHASSLMATTIGITSLCTAHPVTEPNIKESQSQIECYEASGHYATALRIARQSCEASLKQGLSQEATNFSQIITRLETELLTFGSSRLLFDENYQPRVKLLQILELVGMEPLNKSERAVIQINDWAQKNLLRRGERWDEQTQKFEALKPQIKPLLSELGFVEASTPNFKDYQGAIVHGALLSRVRLRLHYLAEQWKQGARFSHLYFLSGERDLEDHENKAALLDDRDSLLKIRKDWVPPQEFPKTECEMIQLVWDQAEIPQEMRQGVDLYFINAPKKTDPKTGKKTIRPNTDDTVETWLKAKPLYGRYLVITNAPYTNRQDLVMRTIAPCQYGFDTIGPAASDQERVAIYLDELARFIFQTKQKFEKK